MTDVMITSAAAEEAKVEFEVVEAPEPVLDEATLTLLAELGFDHVPTIEEAKAALDARRERVREEVLFQADRKNWCEEGTRTVCANLRLKRPGSREQRMVTFRATVDITRPVQSFSDKGALSMLHAGHYLPIGEAFGGWTLNSTEVHEVKVGDTVIDWTDDLKEAITNA